MGFDLAKFIGSTLAEKPRQVETNVRIHQAPNKKTGSYVTRVGMNNGRSVTRIDTQSGCVLGRACYIDMSRPYTEIKQQIKEAYEMVRLNKNLRMLPVIHSPKFPESSTKNSLFIYPPQPQVHLMSF